MPLPLKAGYHFHYSHFCRPPYFEMTAAEAYTDFYGLSYTVSGENLCYSTQGTFISQAGDISLIPKNVYFRSSYLSDTPREEILLKFTAAMISDLLAAMNVKSFDDLLTGRELTIHLKKSEQKEVLRIMNEMEEEWNMYDQYSETVLKGLLNKLIVLCLGRRGAAKKAAAAGKEEKEEKTDKLDEAIAYVKANLSQSPSLRETAAHIRISPSYISKLFVNRLHTPYSAFVLNEKILYAQKLLVDSDASMAEIAGKSGFSGNTYFSDCFKRITGMSPLQFRKAYKTG